MLLHTDASTHAWVPGLLGRQDLIVVMDDATSEVYYAQLVREESTFTMMAALKAVVEGYGVFCSLYVDRASHFITTRTGSSPHRSQQATEPTQIQRALGQLDMELIPAGSPQARGRMERLWETWQGRLPQELRLAGIRTVEAANTYLARRFVSFHNQTWTQPAEGEGTAFVPYTGAELDRIFAVVHDRVVGLDNAVEFQTHRLQILPARFRHSFAKCRVKVYEHLNGTISIGFGPHSLGHFNPDGKPLTQPEAVQAA
jgi:hypothetical protein